MEIGATGKFKNPIEDRFTILLETVSTVLVITVNRDNGSTVHLTAGTVSAKQIFVVFFFYISGATYIHKIRL